MDVTAIGTLSPGSAPAPAAPAGGGLFGDLLRSVADSASPSGPAAPPERAAAARPPQADDAPAAGRSDEPRNAAGEDVRADREAGEVAPRDDRGADDEPAEAADDTDEGSEGDGDLAGDADRAPVANGAVHVAAHSQSEVAQAVVAFIAGDQERAPGAVADAALAAVAVRQASGASGPIEPAPVSGAAPADLPPAESTIEPPPVSTAGQEPEVPQPRTSDPLPELPEGSRLEVTVSDPSKSLVSRPTSALAAQTGIVFAVEDDGARSEAQDPVVRPACDARGAAEVKSAATADALPELASEAKLAHAAFGSDPAEPAQHRSPPAAEAAPQLSPQPAAGAGAPSGFAAALAPQVAALLHTDPALPPPRLAPAPGGFEQVAVQISKAVADGLDHITIQLKPESLGRIGVELHVHHDGRVAAVIAADRPETLDLLQRDARALERALQDAGLRTDSGSLSFNLNGSNREDADRLLGPAPGASELREPDEAAAAAASPPYAAAPSSGGIDIRV